MPDPAREPSLRCLDGAAPPGGIAADLARAGSLPAAARERLWEVLGPSLPEPVPDGLDARVVAFCAEVRAREDDVAAAVRACRFLLREAAAAGLARATFAADLGALSADPAITAVLLPRFDAAKKRLRAEIVRGSLTDHGKLLERASYRVDTMSSSSRGKDLGARVVSMTLDYRDGSRQRRITLQMSPESVRELRRLCDRILG